MPSYRFVEWVDEVGNVWTTPTITLLIDQDKILTAHYELVALHELTLASDKPAYYMDETVVLSGFLTLDGAPVPGALVTLYRNGVSHLETTTLADGSFSFMDPAGNVGTVEYFAEHIAGFIFRSPSLTVRRG